MLGVMVTDAAGVGSTPVAPGSYRVSGSLEGRLIGPEVSAVVTTGQTAQAAVVLGEAHTLTVTVKDAANAPMPASSRRWICWGL